MAKGFVPNQLGLFRPESAWRAPTELPDLRRHSVVAIDTETKDDGISAGLGPGWALGPAGYLTGVSYAADGIKGYVPLRHPETENFPLENVMRWLDDLFAAEVPIVFHNGPYDIGWTGAHGVREPWQIEDTGAAAVMIDEQQRSYSLDSCLSRAGLPLKNKALMQEAIRAYGGDPSKGAKDNYLVPARFVGEYAEDDAALTLALWHTQKPQLQAQGMWDAYRLEMELIPIVIAMRRRGIRIDMDRAEELARAFRENVDRLCGQATRMLSGRRRVTFEDLNSPQWLAQAFTEEGIKFPKTASGKQGSFSKDWMDKSSHWLPKLVVEAREYQNAASKFVENFILSYAHRGRLHAEVHQFKTDDGGTRSQRFSYSGPALQQMPGIEEGPDKLPVPAGEHPWEFYGGIGGAIRSCFLPEKGTAWLAGDYSQQEPRITVHFAAVCGMPGAEEAVRRWHENPKLSYHIMVQEMTGLTYKQAKILNLAATYGKRARSLAAEMGITVEEAEALLAQYHSKLPYVKPLEDLCKSKASQRGFIKLIDGARMHYDQWEGPYQSEEERAETRRLGYRTDPCSMEEARVRQAQPGHPWAQARLRRADTRKALNNLIQGSAARQTKKAVRDAHRAGYLAMLQMHDELDFPVESKRQVQELEEIMRNAQPLRVPVLVDAEVGSNWGEAKYSWDDFEAKFLRAS